MSLIFLLFFCAYASYSLFLNDKKREIYYAKTELLIGFTIVNVKYRDDEILI